MVASPTKLKIILKYTHSLTLVKRHKSEIKCIFALGILPYSHNLNLKIPFFQFNQSPFSRGLHGYSFYVFSENQGGILIFASLCVYF